MDRMTTQELKQLQQAETGDGRQKYRSQRETVDGITFDSRREARRWRQLRLMERAGEIRDLERQVVLELEGRDGPLRTRTGKTMRITVDFRYFDVALGLTVWEDCKGFATRDYEVRRAVAAAMGITVVES